MMGLINAASGCPKLAFFKPMARFHLPLASQDETIYRAVSTYLLAQYFVRKAGGAADLDLHGLQQIYTDIQSINVSMARRLREASKTDSAVNALVILDMYAQIVPELIENSLVKLRPIFSVYLEAEPGGPAG
jgi:hypothetical protein